MEEETMEGGGGGGGGGGGIGCPNGVKRGLGLPPFLINLYSIVNDPRTNECIAWGSDGTSIIIWNHIAFSAHILPKHFKHNNFSSFVYQLNNYGFRKIGVDHEWEYANPNFRAGEESLLKEIKRRKQKIKTQPRKRTLCSSSTQNNNGMEAELQVLRNQVEETKVGIQKIKTQQAEIELQILEAKNFRTKTDDFINFLATVCAETFAHGEDETSKKTKLSASESSIENAKMGKSDAEVGRLYGEIQEDGNETVKEGESDRFPEKQSVSSDESANSVDRDHKRRDSGDRLFWEKMVVEDNCEDCGHEEVDQKIKGQARIAAELEGLIANLPNQDIKQELWSEGF